MVTIDSTDTRERHQFQHYTARHVKVQTQVEPSPGAATPARVEETDGWYIDLPGLGCQEQSLSGVVRGTVQARAFATLGSRNRQDRLRIKCLGTARRGYPIEVTALTTEAGNKTISKVELLEISEAAVNPSLFDLPARYRLALQTGNGGGDLTKPDTVANRAEYYWAKFAYWVRGFFR